eukprot:3265915-Prymnesium_polylepis.1
MKELAYWSIRLIRSAVLAGERSGINERLNSSHSEMKAPPSSGGRSTMMKPSIPLSTHAIISSRGP